MHGGGEELFLEPGSLLARARQLVDEGPACETLHRGRQQLMMPSSSLAKRGARPPQIVSRRAMWADRVARLVRQADQSGGVCRIFHEMLKRKRLTPEVRRAAAYRLGQVRVCRDDQYRKIPVADLRADLQDELLPSHVWEVQTGNDEVIFRREDT